MPSLNSPPRTFLRPAAFIDRDGVINEERDYVHRVEDFHLLPGVVEGLKALQAAGYLLVVVTNQAGIGRGFYTEDDYVRLMAHLDKELALHGVRLAGAYHCPHHPTAGLGAYKLNCECRKPKAGMLKRAATELGIDLARSFIVGDKGSDLAAGRAAAVRWAILVQSGHDTTPDDHAIADRIVPGLNEAANWICAQPA